MAEFDHMVANPTALNPQPSRLMIPYNGIQMQCRIWERRMHTGKARRGARGHTTQENGILRRMSDQAVLPEQAVSSVQTGLWERPGERALEGAEL